MFTFRFARSSRAFFAGRLALKTSSNHFRTVTNAANELVVSAPASKGRTRPQHAVISTFDLMSIGIGPSSSHTVGPMRAAKIFAQSLIDQGILDQIVTLKIALYGSLAATGKGHMSPEALLSGMEFNDCESVDTDSIVPRFESIRETKRLLLGGQHTIDFDMKRDFIWYMDRELPFHPNGMIFSVYSSTGDLLANNQYYSIGGGFVVNEATQFSGENVFYKDIRATEAGTARKDPAHVSTPDQPKSILGADSAGTAIAKEPPFLYEDATSLLELTRKHNMTIAQIVYENEKHYLSDDEIKQKLLNLYRVMDGCIRQGVSSNEEYLPGGLRVKRRAKHLYSRLQRGFYSADQASSLPSSAKDVQKAKEIEMIGLLDHPLQPVPPRRTSFPALDLLSCYAIAVNEVNAAGGRVVTSPTNGASGVIPSVLKYFVEFLSEDPERDVQTFLLTAAAIGMLFKRSATISAAEGGCMAEVGVACSMAAAGFAACLGASPAIIENAAEIGIEHNMGLTCDPILGLVQIPCIGGLPPILPSRPFRISCFAPAERNALGAVKAVTAAQLALASGEAGDQAIVSLDDAITAMRKTAEDMKSEYKETSRAGLATAVRVSAAVPEC